MEIHFCNLESHLLLETLGVHGLQNCFLQMHHINLKENSEMSTREYEAFHKLLEKDDPQLGPLFQKISSRNPEQSMAYKSTTKLPLPPDTQSNTVTGAAAAVSRGDFQAKLNRTLSPTFKKGASPAPKEGIDANEDLVSVVSWFFTIQRDNREGR